MIHLFLCVLLPFFINSAEPDSPRTVFQKKFTQLKQSQQLSVEEKKRAISVDDQVKELFNLLTHIPIDKLDKPLADLKEQWDTAEKWCLSTKNTPGMQPWGFATSAYKSHQQAIKHRKEIEVKIVTYLQKNIQSD